MVRYLVDPDGYGALRPPHLDLIDPIGRQGLAPPTGPPMLGISRPRELAMPRAFGETQLKCSRKSQQLSRMRPRYFIETLTPTGVPFIWNWDVNHAGSLDRGPCSQMASVFSMDSQLLYSPDERCSSCRGA